MKNRLAVAVGQSLANPRDDAYPVVQAQVWICAQKRVQRQLAIQMFKDDAGAVCWAVSQVAAQLQDVRVVRQQRQRSCLTLCCADQLFAPLQGHPLRHLVRANAGFDAGDRFVTSQVILVVFVLDQQLAQHQIVDLAACVARPQPDVLARVDDI